jgi:hypothetical protein
MGDMLSAVKERRESKEPSRSAFAELSSMRGPPRAADNEETADDLDVLRHALAGSKAGRGAPPPRARFADVLGGLGGPALGRPAARGRSREPREDPDHSDSDADADSADDTIDPDDVAAGLRENPEQLVRTVLAMLQRGGFRSATEWAERTRFEEPRNKRECLFLADTIDDYLIIHRGSHDFILAKLMARMVGVQMADFYRDWSYCNVMTGTTAPGLLLDLAWMKRLRRSARVYRSFAPAPPKSDSKKSDKPGAGSIAKAGYDYGKSADAGDRQRSSSKGKSNKSKSNSRKSGKSPSRPAKDSAASGNVNGGGKQ